MLFAIAMRWRSKRSRTPLYARFDTSAASSAVSSRSASVSDVSVVADTLSADCAKKVWIDGCDDILLNLSLSLFYVNTVSTYTRCRKNYLYTFVSLSFSLFICLCCLYFIEEKKTDKQQVKKRGGGERESSTHYWVKNIFANITLKCKYFEYI